MSEQKQEITVQQVAAYLLNSINNNATFAVPARETEVMSAAKQWLKNVSEAPAATETVEAEPVEDVD